MTVQELYDFAKKKNALDCEITIRYATDGAWNYCGAIENAECELLGDEICIDLIDFFEKL